MRLLISFILIFMLACSPSGPGNVREEGTEVQPSKLTLVILGTVQDGGSPHPECKKECCKKLFLQPDEKRQVVSLGIIDPVNQMNFLFEATPDLPRQLRTLSNYSSNKTNDAPDAIFLTHAHIGHYAGLMYLGREAANTNKVPVYAMPRMKTFLETNGPWSQLVALKNIELRNVEGENGVSLNPSLKIKAFTVPHRDEFSETVAYLIEGPAKKALFIPDIDKWSKWDKSITEEIRKVDYAFIDGTFFDSREIRNRSMAEIPHPFVIESMKLFDTLPQVEKNKVWFIHFNHTNPLLRETSNESREVEAKGFHISRQGQLFEL